MPPSSRQPSRSAKVGQKGLNESNRKLSEVPHTVKVTLLGLTGIQYNQGWKNDDLGSSKERKSSSNANATCFPPEKTRAIVNFARSNKQKLGTSPLSGPLQLSHRHKVSVLKNKNTSEKQKRADEDVEVEIANEATSTDRNPQRYVALWNSQKGEGNQTLPLVSFETTLSKSSDPDSSTNSKPNFAPKSFQVMVGLAPDQNKNIALPIGMASLTITGDELPKVRDGQVFTREIDLPLISLEQATPQFGTGKAQHPQNDYIYFDEKKSQKTGETAVSSKSLDTVPEHSKKIKRVRFGMFSKSKKTKNAQPTANQSSKSLDRKSFNSQYTVDSEGEVILRVAIEVYDKSTNDEKRIQFQRLKQKLNEESALSKRSQKTGETESDVFSDATKDTDIMNNLNDATKKLFDNIRESSGLNSVTSNQTKTTTNVSLVDHSDSEDENDKHSLESIVSGSTEGSASNTYYTHSTNGTHTTNDGSISFHTDDVSVIDTVGSSYKSIDADEESSSDDEEYNENNQSGSDHDDSTVARGTGKRMTKLGDLLSCTDVRWKDRMERHTTCGGIDQVDMDQVEIVASYSDLNGAVSVIKTNDSPQGVEEVNSPSSIRDEMNNSIRDDASTVKSNPTPTSFQTRMMNMFTCGASAEEVDDAADRYSQHKAASRNQSLDENDPPRYIEQMASWRSAGTYLTETSFEEHERRRNEIKEARKEEKRKIIRKEVDKTHFTSLPLPAAFGGSGFFVKSPNAMTHKERDERDRITEEALDDFTLTQTFTEDGGTLGTLGSMSLLDVNSKS